MAEVRIEHAATEECRGRQSEGARLASEQELSRDLCHDGAYCDRRRARAISCDRRRARANKLEIARLTSRVSNRYNDPREMYRDVVLTCGYHSIACLGGSLNMLEHPLKLLLLLCQK